MRSEQGFTQGGGILLVWFGPYLILQVSSLPIELPELGQGRDKLLGSGLLDFCRCTCNDRSILLGRSLIHSRKRVEPKREPCGTLALLFMASDDWPRATTSWDVPVRKDFF